MSTYNFEQRRAIRKGYWRHAYNHGATHTVTFTFNEHGDISPERARAILKKWHARVDRKLYGKQYHKLPLDKRTSFIAFVELPNRNLHYHAVLTTPNPAAFDMIAEKLWQDYAPAGDLHFHKFAFGRKNVARWCCYITKHVMQGRNEEYIIDSSLFKPQP